jgi:hemolysin-activating ACP:hemolysin acyltransferase
MEDQTPRSRIIDGLGTDRTGEHQGKTMAKSGVGKRSTVPKKGLKKANGKAAAKPVAVAKQQAAAKSLSPPAPKKQTPQAANARAHVRDSFSKIVMAMMLLPRYRNQTVADLQHLVLDPLMCGRIATAYPDNKKQNELSNVTGLAIWASVSEEADARIRSQIKVGTFPVRLKYEDWNSGKINWLLDVIAPNAKMTSTVISNFGKVVKGGSLRLHPLIAKLVDEDMLKKLDTKRPAAAEKR